MTRIPRWQQWSEQACYHLMDRGHNRDTVFHDDEDRAPSRAGDGLVSDLGTVALRCIPLLPEGLQGFDVDRDPLVAMVVACFTAIGAKDVQALARPVEDDGD